MQIPSDLKELIILWFDEVWNRGSSEAVDEMMAPDCETIVEGIDTPLTREGFKEYQRAFLNAVPDLRAEVTFIVTEGATAIANWRARGTHTGAGLGIPPSGRAVDFTGLSVFEIAENRIVRGFDRWNRGEMIASLMQVRMDELRDHVGFTPREAQVALLMTERLTYPEIAIQLKIKPNTARRHCERVLAKAGVRRRQDLAQVLGKIPGSVLNRHGTDPKSSAAADRPH